MSLALGKPGHYRRPSASLPRHPTHVPVRSVVLKLLAAAPVTMAEAVGTAARLPDGEIRGWTGRRRLSFRSRERGANQWTVHRALFQIRLPIERTIVRFRGVTVSELGIGRLNSAAIR